MSGSPRETACLNFFKNITDVAASCVFVIFLSVELPKTFAFVDLAAGIVCCRVAKSTSAQTNLIYCNIHV